MPTTSPTSRSDPFESPVLERGIHDRLVQDLDRIAREAGIPPVFIVEPLATFCGAGEVRWITRFPFHASKRRFGLYYDGARTPPAQFRMLALCGALIRNFVHAQVRQLDEVLEEAKSGVYPSCTALFIPDFFLGKKLPDWRVALLTSLLFNRMAEGKQTIVSISSMGELKVLYGDAVGFHVETYFSRA